MITKQTMNGYLEINYLKDGWVKIIDTETNMKIELHVSAINIIKRTINQNNKMNIARESEE